MSGEKALKEVDKKLLTSNVNALADAYQVKRIFKAVSVARAADFFTQLRKDWGEWEKIRRRILAIMGKYLESEEEKRMNLLMWAKISGIFVFVVLFLKCS